MSAQLATLLALVGAALAAVAVFAPHRLPAPSPAVSALLHPPAHEPEWVRALDAGAVGTDARARVELVEALGALASPWAQALLCEARDADPDGSVRAAAVAALAQLTAGEAFSTVGM